VGQPLDKQQALFYGKFVQAAYTMFENPQSGLSLQAFRLNTSSARGF
jgi:hypothetical protein